MKLMIFTEGTIIMHPSAKGLTREQIVEQVKNFPRPLPGMFFKTHIPVGNSYIKLKKWFDQGVKILYLTSRTELKQIADVKDVLDKYNFPKGRLLWRKQNQSYSQVAESEKPDILIEDDCESIGGEKEMTITYVKPKIKQKIKSIVIKEFGGIDHLPDDINDLLKL